MAEAAQVLGTTVAAVKAPRAQRPTRRSALRPAATSSAPSMTGATSDDRAYFDRAGLAGLAGPAGPDRRAPSPCALGRPRRAVSATRARGRLPRALLLVLGFAASVLTLALLGGPDPGARPSNYFVSVTLMWLAVGAAALWVSVLRGPSMLGRPVSWKLAVAALTPVGALASSARSWRAIAWPATIEPAACAGRATVSRVPHLHAHHGPSGRSRRSWPSAAAATPSRPGSPAPPSGRRPGRSAGSASSSCASASRSCTSPSATCLPVVALTLLGVWLGGRVLAVKAPRSA